MTGSKKCAAGCACGRHNRPRPGPEEVARLRAMSANRLGAKSSEEHCRKISEALTGRPLSEEHRRKMAEINADPELLKQKGKYEKVTSQAS